MRHGLGLVFARRCQNPLVMVAVTYEDRQIVGSGDDDQA
jgi:hypothetical protein